MIIVQLNDFVAEFQLPRTTATDVVLQGYIDRWELETIMKLLGVELGNLFIADLVNGVPQTARFVTIYNPFQIQQQQGVISIDGYCNCYQPIWISQGIKFILLSVIYFKYIAKTQVKASQGGATKNETSVSMSLNPRDALRFGEQKYNQALDSIYSVQYYCRCYKKPTYPEFQGIPFVTQYRSYI